MSLSEESKTEQVTIRVTPAEKLGAQKLANYLHKQKKLDEPTIAGAFRVSLHYTVNEILKSIEAERYG